MKNKIVTILCALVCTVSSVSPVYAMDITAPTDNAEVPLAFSKDSYFTVTLPETISAEKNTKSVDFNYSVEGDISADEKVTVNLEDGNPDIEGYQLKLSDITGKTKDANISIGKTDFAYNEITSKVTESGSVSFNDLTAGRWSGTAKFVIGLENIGVTEEAGLYDADGNMLCALTADDVEKDYTFSSPMTTSLGVDSSQITRVVIPEGITSIGNNAFYNCTSLTSVTIPDSVTSIGDMVFSRCTSLTSITIPSSVTSIGNEAFDNCSSLTNVTIPDSVTSIGCCAFSHCTSLTSITLPNNVTSIGYDAFNRCTKLSSATFKNTSGWYVGDTAGAKTTALSSSDLANASTAATYLKSNYSNKYWTR